MLPPFLAASAWSASCSELGSLAAGWAVGCPACAPVLHCPSVACHCGRSTCAAQVPCPTCFCSESAAVAQTPCSTTSGSSWSTLAITFVLGLAAGLALAWQLRLWATGGWWTTGHFTVGSEPAEPSPASRRALPAPQPAAQPALAAPRSAPSLSTAASFAAVGWSPALADAAAAVADIPGSDGAVWRPRGSPQ